MAGGKLSPRQKMINLMYLVLTALLALNVSKQVLEAFRVVNEGIVNSTIAVQEKIDLIDRTLQEQLSEKPEIVQPLLDGSQSVSSEVNQLVKFINETKHEVIMMSGGYDNDAETAAEGDYPKNISNYDGSTRFLAEDNPDSRGKDLKNKINETRDKLFTIAADLNLDVADLQSLSFKAEDNQDFGPADPLRRWEYKNFNKVPIAGTLTILDKIINDAKNAESTINSMLLDRVGAVQVKIDKLAAQVLAGSSYLPAGGKYEAKIVVAASSSNLNGKVFIGKLDKSKFEVDENGDLQTLTVTGPDNLPFTGEATEIEMDKGMAKYAPTSSASGTYTYQGVIQMAKPGFEGQFDLYPFVQEYEIAPPAGFSVAATSMNVLYIGLDNPISITVGDARPGSVAASMTNGALNSQGQGKYVARPTAPGKATITAKGTNASGASTGGAMEFRVMRVPDPVPTLGGTLKGGRIQKGTLAAQSGIVALLENFAFDARFTVISYDFILSTKGEILAARDNSGPIIGGQVKNLLNRAQPKDYAIIDNIRVKGPDGTNRKLSSLTFEII